MFGRIEKASKMTDLVLRAIYDIGNVAVDLTLNIFDKQIAPMISYGSVICSEAKSFNLLYFG